MYHCQIDDDYIVMLQSEHDSVIKEAAKDPKKAWPWRGEKDCSIVRTPKQWKQGVYEITVGELKKQKAHDPNNFYETYIFRDKYGQHCLPYFFALMDGYRRLTQYIDCDEIDHIGLMEWQAAHEKRDPFSTITLSLFSVSGILFKTPKVNSKIKISTGDFMHLFGTTKEFTLITKCNVLKFGPNGMSMEPWEELDLDEDEDGEFE